MFQVRSCSPSLVKAAQAQGPHQGKTLMLGDVNDLNLILNLVKGFCCMDSSRDIVQIMFQVDDLISKITVISPCVSP